MITTTLNKIRDNSPCEDGWEKLLKSLGKTKADDEPLTFERICQSNGYDDTLWCLRSLPEQSRLWRHFAVDAAEMVEHLMTDERSKNALRVARRHADGQATDDEWAAAWDSAMAAVRAAQMKLFFEYCRTGERVDWRTFLGSNPFEMRVQK